jgi:predicted HicB family RNase H-like nuclease
MVKLTVRLPESLVERAKIAAVKQKTSLQEMMRVALIAHLKELK